MLEEPRVDRWRWVRLGMGLAYLVAYVAWFFVHGVIIDRISASISIALALVIATIGKSGRAWRMLAVDFVVMASIWMMYDETRGAADRVGMPLQASSVRDIDRFVFGGTDPNVWLQQRYFSDAVVHWYDVVASIVYYSHFIVPVVILTVLRVRYRAQWVRFMRRFATVLTMACISYVLLPTAPPWMASGGSTSIRLSLLPPLERPAGRGWDAIGLDGFVHAWETGRDWVNPVAAMPSLHAGFALLAVVFWFPHIQRRSVRVAMLAYPLVMGVALVYLAEHWVIDITAGWGVVGASFVLWGTIERRRDKRQADGVESASVPGEVDLVDPAETEEQMWQAV
ncbi:MAG: phosphatase PAP2 family protein [Actinomycetota bacterium]|nr:phosphatase PAP2 family protein [Actinomycetota bacterium]